MISHARAVELSNKQRSAAEDVDYDEYLADLEDRIARIGESRSRLKQELAGYQSDWDAAAGASVPTVPKAELAKFDDPHGDAIRYLEGPLFAAEVLDAKRVTARRRLAHGPHEDASLAAEEKHLNGLRKEL